MDCTTSVAKANVLSTGQAHISFPNESEIMSGKTTLRPSFSRRCQMQFTSYNIELPLICDGISQRAQSKSPTAQKPEVHSKNDI